MPKILLIRPPSPVPADPSHTADIAWPPLGLASIGAFVRHLSDVNDVEIKDLVVEPSQRISEAIEQLRPDCVGIGCMSSDYAQAVEVADEIKRITEIPIVLGGVHPTVEPVSTLSNASVDYVVVGEGEHTFADLMDYLLSSKDTSQISQIRGVAYKKHGNCIVNPMREPVKDISSLPFPAYDLLPMGLYAQHAKRDTGFKSLDMVVSRGCPFGCSFCAVSIIQGRRARLVDVKSLVREIKRLLHTYGVEGVWFKDSNFTINRTWVTEFCNEVRSLRLDLPWVCNSRVDLVDAEVLETMKRAGLTKIWLGVESGSRRTLKTLSKDISLRQIKTAFQLCRQFGIQAGAFFMIGIPGERIEDIRATVALAEQLQADQYRWHIYAPLPGSKLYDVHKAKLTGISPRFDQAAMGTGYLAPNEIDEIYAKICSYFYGSGSFPLL